MLPMKWNTDQANWNFFEANLQIPPLTGDINKDVTDFTHSIIFAASKSIPRKGGRIPRTPVPWWTPDCAEANRQKKKAFNRFKRQPTENNLISFKRYRAIERFTIKKARKESFERYASTITTSTCSSEVWRKIRSFSGKSPRSMVPIISVNENIYTESYDIAEKFADFFEKVSSTNSYSDTFKQIKSEDESKQLNFASPVHFPYNDPFTLDELEKVLSTSKESAPGPDEVTNAMIRHLPPHAKLHLLCLYNDIWNKGIFPHAWKESLIIPIPKAGKDHSKLGNYRPISLTSCLSKVLESMMLTWVLESAKLISKYQAGFRKCYSTLDQLCFLENAVQEGFAQRKHTVAVFFDIEKAFDSAWRFGILQKCYDWGLRGNLPILINDFLSGRAFRVRISNVVSGTHFQENGTPQGSVLSVTLFLIAINNIADDVSDIVGKSLYVDDLCLFSSGECIQDIAHRLQSAINAVADRAEKNGLKLSLTKTNCIHFCRLRKEHDDPPLYLNDEQIMYVDSIRYLGLVFDKRLTWQAHITYTATRCKKALNVLKAMANINWGIEREMLLRMFCMLIRSIMDYGSAVYSSASKSRLKVLDRLHHQGLRIATGAFHTSRIQSIYCEAEILPPHNRREQLILTYLASLWGKKEHFLYDIIFEPQTQEFSLNRAKTLRLRGKQLLLEEGIELPSVMEDIFPPSPPWKFPSVQVYLNMAAHPKETTAPSIYKAIFQEIVTTFSDSHIIYTDGSKTSEGVGAGMYSDDTTSSWALPQTATVYTAEMLAIYEATKFCCSSNHNRFIICTDSLSVLQALRNKFSRDPMIIKLYLQIQALEEQKKQVVFAWVPGHVGIMGNEQADQVAKIAAASPPSQSTLIRSADVKQALCALAKARWQREWNICDTMLRNLKPNVRTNFIDNLPRRDRVILTRLRIGHTRITHVHLLLKKRPPKCPFCQEIVTVPHILEECQSLKIYRDKAGLPSDWKTVLKPGSQYTKSLMLFLNNVNLYKRI